MNYKTPVFKTIVGPNCVLSGHSYEMETEQQ